MMRGASLTIAMLLGCAAGPCLAAPDFTPRIGTQIDLSTPVADAGGSVAPLSGITGGKPALVLFGYYNCPNLCGTAQVALAHALAATGLGTEDYRALFVTVDPEETATDAAAGRTRLIAATTAADVAPWRFLNGPGVVGLADEFGIGVEARARIEQLVHPVGVIALTPDGRISRVLGGIDFQPGDLRLAVIEASQGRLGTLVEKILLFCAGFDDSTGRYTWAVATGLRLAALATLLVGGGFIVLMMRRERRR